MTFCGARAIGLPHMPGMELAESVARCLHHGTASRWCPRPDVVGWAPPSLPPSRRPGSRGRSPMQLLRRARTSRSASARRTSCCQRSSTPALTSCSSSTWHRSQAHRGPRRSPGPDGRSTCDGTARARSTHRLRGLAHGNARTGRGGAARPSCAGTRGTRPRSLWASCPPDSPWCASCACRDLAEGVDVPALDGVAFVDPRSCAERRGRDVDQGRAASAKSGTRRDHVRGDDGRRHRCPRAALIARAERSIERFPAHRRSAGRSGSQPGYPYPS